MLLNLKSQEINKAKQLLASGKIVQDAYDSHIMENTTDKPWDGYIHPSYLDWNKRPEQQLKGLLNKGNITQVEAHRRFRLGNMIHEDVQAAIQKKFPGYDEIGYKSDKLLFAGTADYVGTHPLLGTTLFEFKSFSELQRDATAGNNYWWKIESQCLSSMKRTNWKPGMLNQYHLFTDKQIEDIKQRLLTKEKILIEPASDHLTQAFTYTWIFNHLGYGVQRLKVDGQEVLKKRKLKPIKRVCVCYIGKSGLVTTEFWYRVADHEHLVEKAKANYLSVRKAYLRWQDGQDKAE